MSISGTEPFSIGGAGAYEAAIPFTTTLHLTLIDETPEDADTFFPEFNFNDWEKISESETIMEEGRPGYKFLTLARKR